MFLLYHAIKEFGLREYLRQLIYHRGYFMGGVYRGSDALGNRYFEVISPKFQGSGRLRYVEYANKNYDASQIQPEWHGWIHMTHQEPPTERPDLYPKIIHDPSIPLENMTGSVKRYAPSSTVPPKFTEWKANGKNLEQSKMKKLDE